MLLLFRNLGFFFRLIFFIFVLLLAEKRFGWRGRKIIILMSLMDCQVQSISKKLENLKSFPRVNIFDKIQTFQLQFNLFTWDIFIFFLFRFGYITVLWSPLFKIDQLIPLNYTKTFSLIAETFKFYDFDHFMDEVPWNYFSFVERNFGQRSRLWCRFCVDLQLWSVNSPRAIIQA